MVSRRMTREDKSTQTLAVSLVPPCPVEQEGSSGRNYAHKAAKLLLQSEDGSFAREDTGVRLD